MIFFAFHPGEEISYTVFWLFGAYRKIFEFPKFHVICWCNCRDFVGFSIILLNALY